MKLCGYCGKTQGRKHECDERHIANGEPTQAELKKALANLVAETEIVLATCRAMKLEFDNVERALVEGRRLTKVGR